MNWMWLTWRADYILTPFGSKMWQKNIEKICNFFAVRFKLYKRFWIFSFVWKWCIKLSSISWHTAIVRLMNNYLPFWKCITIKATKGEFSYWSNLGVYVTAFYKCSTLGRNDFQIIQTFKCFDQRFRISVV